MTEYKTIDGEIYAFAGSKKTGVEAEKQAGKYRAQGRLCKVVPEERMGARKSSLDIGQQFVYATYTRSK